MSLFRPVNLVCPNCKELIVMQAVGSVNADRRPDFRDAILADEFQDVTCESCQHEFRLQLLHALLDARVGHLGLRQAIDPLFLVGDPARLDLGEHIAFVIEALRPHADELGITGRG